jgi:hypothetical protein
MPCTGECGRCKACFTLTDKDVFRMKEAEKAMTKSSNFTELATAVETLGTILEHDQGRDAIHVAVVACTSTERLHPGQHVTVTESDGSHVASAAASLHNGIVDPFLDQAAVWPGNRFWVLLYPRTITSLRHLWTHPDFRDEADVIRSELSELVEAKAREMFPQMLSEAQAKEKAEKEAQAALPAYQKIQDFLNGSDVPLTVEDFVNAGTGPDWDYREPNSDNWDTYGWSNGGEYLTILGRDAYGEIPPEMWDAVEDLSGKRVPPERRATYFSCSC